MSDIEEYINGLKAGDRIEIWDFPYLGSSRVATSQFMPLPVPATFLKVGKQGVLVEDGDEQKWITLEDLIPPKMLR